MTPGVLSDHYDPRKRALLLSEANYHGSSVAALGVACHEAGHALQHANGYVPLQIRQAIWPVTAFGSNLAMPLFFIGLIFSFPQLMDVGIVLFAIAAFFALVTLARRVRRERAGDQVAHHARHRVAQGRKRARSARC